VETLEYTTIDKSDWPRGEWDNEPDKIQFPDPETGLPTLIVRGPSGALCGYVGVTEEHPWYKKSYNSVCVYVHGGLTFSSMCTPDPDESKDICHIPGPGEPDHVWWLGFDCAHGEDVRPEHIRFEEETDRRMAVTHPELTARVLGMRRVEYRTVAYVKEQCAQLAHQIQAHPECTCGWCRADEDDA
jgi:hypothetical protein